MRRIHEAVDRPSHPDVIEKSSNTNVGSPPPVSTISTPKSIWPRCSEKHA
jgi:hypothetical protein